MNASSLTKIQWPTKIGWTHQWRWPPVGPETILAERTTTDRGLKCKAFVIRIYIVFFGYQTLNQPWINTHMWVKSFSRTGKSSKIKWSSRLGVKLACWDHAYHKIQLLRPSGNRESQLTPLSLWWYNEQTIKSWPFTCFGWFETAIVAAPHTHF